MNQKRMIHTTIWVSGQVAKLSRDARLLYIGTITIADDDGRLKGSPAYLRSQIFPYDEDVTIGDVRKWLEEILKLKLITKYIVEDEDYLSHPNWSEYQTLRADRRKESHIPSPDGQMATSGQPTDNQDGDNRQPKVSKGKVRKDKKSDLTLFDQFYSAYPRKIARKNAIKAWEKINVTPELLKTMLDAIEKQKKSSQWSKDGGKFIPHPATWLNAERWNDEVEADQGSATKSTKVRKI